MNKININYTVLILGIVSIVELGVNHNIEGSFWLWFGYGVYRMFIAWNE